MIYRRELEQPQLGLFTCIGSGVSEREDVVFGGGDSGSRAYQGIQPERVGKGLALPYSIILVELEAIFAVDHSGPAFITLTAWYLKGGHFRRSAIFKKLSGIF